MILPLDIILLIFLVIAAVVALKLRDLLGATMVFSIYGFLICLIWAEMGAVDVAFTEATVGAGISGALMIATIFKTARKSSD